MSETEAPAAKGRPRPSGTIERDAQVLKWLGENAGGKTRAEIVEGTGLPGNEVYLSLYRLSRANPPAIVKSGAKWSTTATEPAAEATAAA